MIRLSAVAAERPETVDRVFLYTISVPGHEPFVTSQESHAVAHLDALGVENPELLVKQMQQWREIEICPTKG
jgi:hypothetical protein